MTYPPGGPGYPSQAPSQYSAPTQQFDRVPEQAPGGPRSGPGPNKLPTYLAAAVAVLGLAIYLTSFGPLFDGPGGTPRIILVIAPVLAGLLAGASLLPKRDDRSTISAVLAVLGFLLIILVVLGDGSSIDWAFYPFIVFSVLQAIVAVWRLLLDTGVVRAPTPKPKAEQQPYGQYGAPSYYGQSPYGGAPPQQSSHPPQYGGGYQSGPSTGGFTAIGRPGGPQNGPHSGPPTPPTGFPAFGQPQHAQPAASGSGQSHNAFEGQQPQHSAEQAPQQSAPPPS
jgi:Family of unknown function (DUF5336)